MGVMHRRAFAAAIIGVLAVDLLAAGASAEAAPPAPPAAKSLPAPEHISPEARQLIKVRMGQHGATMENLMKAVSVLDRPTIRALSLRIADEEVVARSGGAGGKLPAAFFAEQDKLAASARQLAAAAVQGGDDKALADRFAEVAHTCVGCHSAYLHDHPEPPPAAAKGKK